MTQPNLALFQAAATAIPALLIAMAVGLGRGKAMAKGYSEAHPMSRHFRLQSMLIAAVVIGNAEINALLAVGRGYGTREQAFWVMLGIILALYNVVAELVMPMIVAEEAESKCFAGFLHTALLLLVLTAVFFGCREYIPF